MTNDRVVSIRTFAESLPDVVWTSHGKDGKPVDNPERRRLLDLLDALDAETTRRVEVQRLLTEACDIAGEALRRLGIYEDQEEHQEIDRLRAKLNVAEAALVPPADVVAAMASVGRYVGHSGGDRDVCEAVATLREWVERAAKTEEQP